MRLPLLVGTILLWKLRICCAEADHKKVIQRHIPPFRKDLYPEEYKFERPIPMVFSDDLGDSGLSSSSSTSGETGSLENVSSFSKKSLLLPVKSEDALTIDKKGRKSPGIVAYWRKQKTRPKKKIRKTKPKITAYWGPPRKTKKQSHSHGPPPHHHHHGPPPPHHHGPPPPHHFHHGPPPPHHYHHHGPHRRVPGVVALWKENKKYSPKWKPKDHKLFRRVELLPEYLTDLRKRLTHGLGILPGPPKHHKDKKHISYHSGFFTEIH